MQTVTLRIEVQDGEVTQATEELKKLGYEADKVEKKTKKAGKTTEDSFNNASDSASNLQGGVEGVGQEFVKVGKAAKVSGKAMRSAIISTGIGALIVALGIVIDNWEKISLAIGLTNKDLERQISLQKDLIDETNHELELLTLKQKQLEAEGKSAEHILEQKKELNKQLITENELLLASLKTQLAKEQAAAVELSLWEKINVALGNSVSVAKNITNDEELENLRKLREGVQSTEVTIEKLKLSLIELNNPKESRTKRTEKPEKRVIETATFEGESDIADPFNEQKEADAQRLEALREGTEEFALAQNERINVEVEALTKSAEIQNKKTADEQANAEARIRIAEEEARAKELLLGATADGLQAFSEIAGRETGAGKALAVAASLINTYSAIAGQLKAFAGVPIPGYAIAQAIATGAAGFAAVKNILKVKVPYDRGGQSGSFSGGGGASAPAFNVVGTSGVNQLAQSLNQEQQPIQAFVVSSEVTSQQEFERNIQDTASI